MVWINYDCINSTPQHPRGEIVFGGAMCACTKCAKNRYQRKEKIKMAKKVNLREFIDHHLIPEFDAHITDAKTRQTFYDLVEEAELQYLEEVDEKIKKVENETMA